MNYKELIKHKDSKFIRYLLLAFLLFSFFPDSFYNDPSPGLDNSWKIALNLAFKYHLVFGKSFVFTYGPLGILVGRLPIAINFFVYLLFDLYFGITLFLMLKDIFKKQFSYGMVIFLFLCFVLASYQMPDLVYFLYFLFYLFAFIKAPRNPYFIAQAALLSIIGFYLKVSGGTVEVLLFLAAAGYVVIRGKLDIKTYLIILVSYLFTIGISARLLHVHLPGYLKSGLQFIKSYNDAMFVGVTNETAGYAWLALIVILGLLFWVLYAVVVSIRGKEVLKNADELFIYCIISASIYFLFKSTFVRADDHINGFYKNIALLSGFLYLYCPPNLKKRVIAAGCTLVLAASVWALNSFPGNYEPILRIAKLTFFSRKMEEVGHYFGSMVNYNRQRAIADKPEAVDSDWKQVIGDSSVDILPIDISTIFFNRLRYDPRPVIQSYCAYNGYLDNLNFQKYMSPDAPDYILYETSVSDSRYLFFDESWTRLAILSHYTLVGKLKQFLLLKKRDTAVALPGPLKMDTSIARFNEEIMIPGGDYLRYSRFRLRYSLWGKIRSFFFQPPPLQVRITLNDGNSWTFRGIKPILEGGVLVNKFIYNDESFQTWLLSHGSRNIDIRSIRIESDSAGNAPGFVNEFRVENTYYPDGGPSEYEKEMDLMNLGSFAREKRGFIDRFRPIPADTALYHNGNLRYYIDDYITSPLFVSINGWAFREKGYNGNCMVKMLLRSKDRVFELPTTPYVKYGLVDYYKRQDITNMGFRSTAARRFLAPGKYDLGLVIVDTTDNSRWVQYTGKQISIQGNSDNPNIEKLDTAGLASADSKGLRYDVNNIEYKGDQALVWGWAYSGTADARTSANNLILVGDNGSAYRIKTSVAQRHDVAVAAGNPLMEYSGFSVLIPKDDLAVGIYSVGIERIDSRSRQRSIVFSNRKLFIE